MSENERRQRQQMMFLVSLFYIPAIIKLVVMDDWSAAGYAIITYFTFILTWQPSEIEEDRE